MPGPFPGMDPYLEEPQIWRGVHGLLISSMTQALNRDLPPAYAANVDERRYVEHYDRSIYPDISIPKRAAVARTGGATRGGTALAEREVTPGVLTVLPSEMREQFIEILTVGRQRRVVTVIELLSHANKSPGSEGNRLYRQKQQEVLQSQSHLLELDLLHIGTHTVAAPRLHLLEFGTWDCLVCLHRSAAAYQYEYWMNSVRQRLPRVRVPLDGDEPDTILDLQAAFDACYDAGPYARMVDYGEAPPPFLSSKVAEWARGLLVESGL